MSDVRVKKVFRRGAKKRAPRPRPSVGDLSRPPLVTIGTQAPMYRAMKNRFYTRVLKYESFIASLGGQTFIQNSYYIYSPYSKASAAAGSITVNGGPSASLVNLYALFTYFRVRKIAITYTAVQSTSVALPPIYCALLPGTAPSGVGTVANTAIVSSTTNSFVIDPHFSCAFTYHIPPPSSVSYLGNNTLEGGWLASAAQVIPVSTNPGIIAFSTGDALFPSPLVTTVGTLLLEYVMDFKAAD